MGERCRLGGWLPQRPATVAAGASGQKAPPTNLPPCLHTQPLSGSYEGRARFRCRRSRSFRIRLQLAKVFTPQNDDKNAQEAKEAIDELLSTVRYTRDVPAGCDHPTPHGTRCMATASETVGAAVLCRAQEPAITAKLQAMAQLHGGELVGLDFRCV